MVGCWSGVGQVLADVLMNLLYQRRDGDEGAAQRLGFQHASQLFLVLAGWVNSRVLRRVRRVLQRSSHVGGFGGAADDFRAQRVLPRRLVFIGDRGFIIQSAQLFQFEGQHHFNGNAELLVLRFGELRVRERVVRGS